MAQSKQLSSILGRSIPATTKPQQPETAPAPDESKPVGQGAEVAVLDTKATKAPPKPRAVKPAHAVAVAEPQKSIQAYVPASLVRELNIKAAQEDTTVRTIILQGLKALGLPVADEELRDRRK